MTEQDFEASKEVFQRAGFLVGDCWYDDRAFGSWCIEVAKDGLPKQRTVWDGKDGMLVVAVFASTGTWMNKWLGRKKSEQNAEAALAHLEMPVTREWERQVERERADNWAEFQLRQALTKARRLWQDGCYSEYVSELTPYRERLSAAQIKRLDIAQRRTAS